MRLLIADKLHPRAVEELSALPVEVIYEPELTKESLEQRIASAGVLVVRSTPVTATALDNAKTLHLIVRAGAEYQTIDVRAASRRGIYVANCPGKNAAAVAELVMGLLVAIDRRIVDSVTSLREGQWRRAEYSKAEGLYGKTIGIVGMGAVGREVAHRAKAFGLTVIGYSRSLSAVRAAELGILHANSLDELASKSHVVSLHLPINERTRHIVGKRFLAALPPRAILINAARADLIDQAALREAVTTRGLRVGLDVYPDEPRGKDEYKNDLFDLATGENTGAGENAGFVYGTPHIAAATDQAQLAVATETVRIIRSFLLEGHVPNVVNVTTSIANFQVVIRMQDKIGTFANVLSVLKRHGINVEEVTNSVFEGGGASCAKLRMVSRPSETCLQEIRAFDEVLHVDVVTLPNLA
ncbi:NAD(P)-binding domain-containing protein [Pendulispora brunnea]|uniref:D-3-phosphoglycerate dehydrogenase n=1 Tax=Pendulispora brunnea TaxID=2905690 RepID=A0ABZ2JZK2_9BACT